jgi:hypothetical protein
MFINSLKPEEHRLLREVAGRVLAADGVPPWLLTDRELDRWIEAFGPEAAERVLRRRVDLRGGR